MLTFIFLLAVMLRCLCSFQEVVNSHKFGDIISKLDVNNLNIFEGFLEVLAQLVWRSAVLFWDSAYHHGMADLASAGIDFRQIQPSRKPEKCSSFFLHLRCLDL